MQTYRYDFTVRMHDIDAAGVLFFAHLFRHAHDAYEAFMADIGFSLEKLIKDQQRLPLVHSEAHFLQPIRQGEKVSIQLQLKKIGTSSFTVDYSFMDKQNRQLATVSTTHVQLDEEGKQSKPLSEALKLALAKYLVAGQVL